jgi:hypothetical protein
LPEPYFVFHIAGSRTGATRFIVDALRKRQSETLPSTPGENYHRTWPELLKMTDEAQAIVDALRDSVGRDSVELRR